MRILCVLAVSLLLAACATDPDPEDRHFFNHGWLHPHRDLDLDLDPQYAPPPPGQSPMPKRSLPDRYREDPFVN